MNIYFLFEGKSTETKVYPKYLSYLIPELKEVDNYQEVIENNYYIFSSSGYPSIYDDIAYAIDDINTVTNYDYFVICSDAEENSFDIATKNIQKILTENKLKKAIPIIIIQNICIETWFLGNRKVFKENPQNEKLLDYVKFYNVKENDPENMENNGKFNTTAKFHADYLRLLLNERNMCYSKGKTDDVASKIYFDELLKRIETTKHLKSFKVFIDFCLKIKEELIIL